MTPPSTGIEDIIDRLPDDFGQRIYYVALRARDFAFDAEQPLVDHTVRRASARCCGSPITKS